jgi:outer membrane protein assembly factor BamB
MKRALGLLLALAAFLLADSREWPGFRGSSRQGEATGAAYPVRWHAAEGTAWSVAVPGEGWSSPVVSAGRVFLTTATDGGASARVLCYRASTGELLWDKEVFRQKTLRKENRNSYATPTPVADGRRVYVVFGDGSFAALDCAGKLIWTNRDYPHYSQHGLGASPILEDGLLVMPRDGSSDGEDPKLGWQKPWDRSYVVALDAATGKQRWKTLRGLSRIAHVTPNVARVNGRKIVVSGAGDVVQGFDLKTGELLWTGRSQGEGVVPSIVIANGLAFTCSGFEKPAIRAFRLDGRGSVAPAWEQTKGVPSMSSLIHADGFVYSVSANGVVTCLRAENGELVKQVRIGGDHSASPVFGGGHIYYTAEDGEITVVKAGPSLEIVAKNRLDERTQASPALVDGRIYVRTAGRLRCIGPSTGVER